MQNLDDTGKTSVEKLRALKAGSEFDRDYIRYEVEGHRKLLDIQEVYLKAPDNLDQTNVAKLARCMIKEHLALLAESDVRLKIIEHLKAMGYIYVTVDLQGFRSGSMNEALRGVPDGSRAH